MSWRDDTDSSETRGGTQDGNGGSKSNASSSSDGGGGSNYTYRSVPNAKTPTMGNWNTGGQVVGTGSLMGGIRPANQIALPRAIPKPTGFNIPPPPIPPLPIAPIVSPITPPPVYGAPPTRVDLNPATLAPLTIPNYQSTFPARPGAGGIGFGGPQKDQSRLGGNAGGGFGGGGGGGW